MTDKPREVDQTMREVDRWGIGADANGDVEALTPEEYARRVAQRNAEELVDAD